MKLIRTFAAVAAVCLAVPALLAQAPYGYMNLYGTNIVNLSGTPEVSGTIYLQPVNNSGTPISYRVGQGYGAVITCYESGGGVTGCSVAGGGQLSNGVKRGVHRRRLHWRGRHNGRQLGRADWRDGHRGGIWLHVCAGGYRRGVRPGKCAAGAGRNRKRRMVCPGAGHGSHDAGQRVLERDGC
jgi:hypothetical protein